MMHFKDEALNKGDIKVIKNNEIKYRSRVAVLLAGFFFVFSAFTVSAHTWVSGFASDNDNSGDYQHVSEEIISKFRSKMKGFSENHKYRGRRCVPVLRNSDQELGAIDLFRKYFHKADYCKLPLLQDALMGEYLQTNGAFTQTQDPNLKIKLAKIAKILALSYTWESAESGRGSLGPSVINSLTVAVFYFNESYELNPEDTQTLGFLSSLTLALGRIHRDQELVEEGIRLIALSIDVNPVFGLFAAAQGEVRAPVNSPDFQRGIQRFWDYQDECMQTEVDRENTDWTPYLPIEGGEYWKCENTENSLHRTEAFLLIFGDALLKAGDLKSAKTMYENVQYISTAKNWKYKYIVKNRLHNLEKDYEALQTADPSDDPMLVFDSNTIRCSVCHQK